MCGREVIGVSSIRRTEIGEDVDNLSFDLGGVPEDKGTRRKRHRDLTGSPGFYVTGFYFQQTKKKPEPNGNNVTLKSIF